MILQQIKKQKYLRDDNGEFTKLKCTFKRKSNIQYIAFYLDASSKAGKADATSTPRLQGHTYCNMCS